MNWCPLYPTGSSPPLFMSLPPSQSSPLLPTPSPSSLLFFPLSSCPLPFPLAPPLSQSALSQSEWRVIREQGEGWAKDFAVFWSSTSLLSNVYNPPLYVENDWPPPPIITNPCARVWETEFLNWRPKANTKIEKKNDVSFVFPLLSISWLVSGRLERLLKVYRTTHDNLRPHPALGDFPRF